MTDAVRTAVEVTILNLASDLALNRDDAVVEEHIAYAYRTLPLATCGQYCHEQHQSAE